MLPNLMAPAELVAYKQLGSSCRAELEWSGLAAADSVFGLSRLQRRR